MNVVALAVFVGFVAAVVVAFVLVRRMRSYAGQIVLAMLLVPPALFCLFGFAATFEPMDALTQWTFRIGYVVLGLTLVATSVTLLLKRPVPDSREIERDQTP